MGLLYGENCMILPSFNHFWWLKGRKSAILPTVTLKPRSGVTQVIDLGTNGKRLYTFLLVINSNLSPILHRSGGTPQKFGMKLALEN